MPEPLEETARVTRDLIRIDTTNHGMGRSVGERVAAEYVEAHLRGLGLTPQLFESEPGRTSLVARVEGAHPERPALVLHGHLDVVPADPANWSVDPFGGEVRDGMLWGRGAVDMKDMDAMILTALGDILGAGELPDRADHRGVLRRRGERRRVRIALDGRQPPRAVRRRDRGDQRGGRVLDRRRRQARLPAADGGEGPGLDPTGRPRGRRARLARHPRQRGHRPGRSGGEARPPRLAARAHADHARPARAPRRHRPARTRTPIPMPSSPRWGRHPDSCSAPCGPPAIRRCSRPDTSTT